MTQEEKLQWLRNYLKNCLGEELPNVQGDYTFGHHKISDNEVLSFTPTISMHGRVINTISLDTILAACESTEVLTKQSFAVICTNNPFLKDWYLWTLDRGFIEL
jgi:hypothetical protein